MWKNIVELDRQQMKICVCDYKPDSKDPNKISEYVIFIALPGS